MFTEQTEEGSGRVNCSFCGGRVERFKTNGQPFKFCDPDCDKAAMKLRMRRISQRAIVTDAQGVAACYAKGYSVRMAMMESKLSRSEVIKHFRNLQFARGRKFASFRAERKRNWLMRFGHWKGPLVSGQYDQWEVVRLQHELSLTPEQKEKREWQNARKVYREVTKCLSNPRLLQSLREESRQGRTSPI